MNKLPLARRTNIVVQELSKEILIYDLGTHRAFNRNETSAIVYQACDGKTTFDELKSKHKFTDDLIFLALDQLKEEGLVEASGEPASPFDGVSRREAIRKVGLASMIALPMISSLVAPTAAQAQSTVCGTPCTFPSECSTPCANCFGTCSVDGSPCTPGVCTVTGVCIVNYACVGDVGVCTGPGSCGTTGNCVFTGGTCSAGGGFCAVAGTCSALGICSAGTCQS